MRSRTFMITMMLAGAIAVHGALTACGGMETMAHAGGGGSGGSPEPQTYMAKCNPASPTVTIQIPGRSAVELASKAHPYLTPIKPASTSFPSSEYVVNGLFGVFEGGVEVLCDANTFLQVSVRVDP